MRDHTRAGEETNYESISEVYSARKAERRKGKSDNEVDSSRQFIKPSQVSGDEIKRNKKKGKHIKVHTQLKAQLDQDF